MHYTGYIYILNHISLTVMIWNDVCPFADTHTATSWAAAMYELTLYVCATVSQKRLNTYLHRKYIVDSHWIKQVVREYTSGIRASNVGLDSVAVGDSTSDSDGLIHSVVYNLQGLDV